MPSEILNSNDAAVQIRLSADLPPKDTKRWVKSRKLSVIKAIESGQITKEEACHIYDLSTEELESWAKLLKNHGPDALRTTHLRQYRAKDLNINGSA